MENHSDSAAVETGPHPLHSGPHPLFGFRPPPEYVTAARQRLSGSVGWSVAAYLEACLHWLAEEPKTAIAAAAPWSEPRVQHERLANVLRSRIESGTLTDHVPAAAWLAQHYKVSRGTVTEALAVLVNEGLIVSAGHRQGYNVVPRSKRQRHRATSLP